MKLNRPIERTVEDLAGWFASEKIDGFRCAWTGREFQSREGNRFNVPQSWLEAMPEQPLDGELFAGTWGATASAIKAGRWAEVRFHVFDSPVAGNLFTRMASVPKLPDFCRRVDHAPVFSHAHLAGIVANFASSGGEGVVLRSVADNYSGAWFKVKPQNDDEAQIVAARFRTYKTIPASYVLNWKGREIIAKATGRLIPDGTTVTFHFRGLDESGAPRLATVKGPRMFD